MPKRNSMKFIEIFKTVIEALPLVGKFINSLKRKNRKNASQKGGDI